MVTIINHSAYHARAIKMFDAKTGKPGYDFSYPILNTVDIGNLLIMGGSISIQIERMGETSWSFDKEKSQLTIQKNDKTEKHYIDDVVSLCQKMAEHYEVNRDRLYELNMSTAQKKSRSQKGNKNAVKKETATTVISKAKPLQKEENTLFEDETEEEDDDDCDSYCYDKKRTQLTLEDILKRKKDRPKVPEDFLPFHKFKGSKEDYLKYVKNEKREWLPHLYELEYYDGFQLNIFDKEDIPEYILKDHPSWFTYRDYKLKTRYGETLVIKRPFGF